MEALVTEIGAEFKHVPLAEQRAHAKYPTRDAKYTAFNQANL